MPPGLHQAIELLARVIELAGVAVIVVAIVAATGVFLARGFGKGAWREAYDAYRANLGRGILLGLEFLVGADIVATVTAPLTLESVGLLGLVVVIRTFLSFSLETEIEGCWPWKRAEKARGGAEKPRSRRTSRPLASSSPRPSSSASTSWRRAC